MRPSVGVYFHLLCFILSLANSEHTVHYSESEFGDNSTILLDSYLSVSFHPVILEPIKMNQRVTIVLNYTLDCGHGSDEGSLLSIGTSDAEVAIVVGANFYHISCQTSSGGDINRTINLTLHALFIGRANLVFQLWSNTTFNASHRDSSGHVVFVGYPIAVIRETTILDTLFRIFGISFIIFTTIGMGITTDLAVVKEVLKRPVAPIIGFTSQYIVMPLVSAIVISVKYFYEL